MSGNLKLYSFLFAAANGTLLAEEQQIDVARMTNSQPVSTVPNGYSGESPGAGMTDITIRNAIPQGGFEFEMGKYMAGLIPLDIQVTGPGGKSIKGKCFVISDSIRHGVNQEASYEFRARMALSLFS